VTTPLSSMAWVVAGSFIGSFGAAFLKSGAQRLERNVRSFVTNWRLAAGVAAYLVSSAFFVFGNKEGELSVLYPLVSLGYLWTLLWSRLFFGERVTRFKLVGLGLILVGVSLIGIGSSREDPRGGVPAAQHQNHVAVR
jgi:drug/metabolite transporter (DMT)-like permease